MILLHFCTPESEVTVGVLVEPWYVPIGQACTSGTCLMGER